MFVIVLFICAAADDYRTCNVHVSTTLYPSYQACNQEIIDVYEDLPKYYMGARCIELEGSSA